ncbi:hypothetical protein MED222_05635 [Vibrio sp. MED222]|nr:hypothetical protein MED222_05635 [Vibrio sp. MED222]
MFTSRPSIKNQILTMVNKDFILNVLAAATKVFFWPTRPRLIYATCELKHFPISKWLHIRAKITVYNKTQNFIIQQEVVTRILSNNFPYLRLTCSKIIGCQYRERLKAAILYFLFSATTVNQESYTS